MKETYWGYWLIMLGVFVVVVMMLISNVTTQNTEDYYLIKEVTEAAMVDSINYGYYSKYGELKIDREKFVESFLRRFAENVSLNTYTISFHGIYEAPPKVSVKVSTSSRSFVIAGDSTTFDIVNKVDAVLELMGQDGKEDREETPTQPTTPSTDICSANPITEEHIMTFMKKNITNYYDCPEHSIECSFKGSKNVCDAIIKECSFNSLNNCESEVTKMVNEGIISEKIHNPNPVYPVTFDISTKGNKDTVKSLNSDSACSWIANYSGTNAIFDYSYYQDCQLSNPVCKYYNGTFDCKELNFNGSWQYHHNAFNWYDATCSATITCGKIRN